MVEANGLRFRTMADGPATGELCVLLHGFPEGAESWSRQVDALARAGALAVAPDMRGYGGTDAPNGVDSYNLDQLGEDVAGIMRAFSPDPGHISGHDLGVPGARVFAGVHPVMTSKLACATGG